MTPTTPQKTSLTNGTAEQSALVAALLARFPDEERAVRFFEEARWPDGIACPPCGSTTVKRYNVARARGLWYCAECRTQFSVTSGTIMEHTKLPLTKWILSLHLLLGSTETSALQLTKLVGLSWRTAWHLSHRIRASVAFVVPDVSTADEDRVFSLIRSSIVKTNHHASREHLARYVDQYAFKHTSAEVDHASVAGVVRAAEGVRLTLFQSKAGGAALIDRPTPTQSSRARKRS